MTIISLYPCVNIKRIKDKILISNDKDRIEINDDVDVFYKDNNLRLLLENKSHNFDIDHKHLAYPICIQLLKHNYTINYCIYDFEFDRWMCFNNSEIEWTTQYNDNDIALFDNREIAECMIPFDESDSYGVQVRYFIK